MKRAFALPLFLLASLVGFASFVVSQEPTPEKAALDAARAAYQEAVTKHGEESPEAEQARTALRDARRKRHQTIRERQKEEKPVTPPATEKHGS
jgi:uncharacterized membrane protein